jgi:membrane protein implicated in regulation of membrane protease activity
VNNALYIGSAVVIAIGAILAGMRFAASYIYRRGGTEREYKMALDRNTESNEKLTGVVGKVVEQLSHVDRRLDHAEWRLDKLEATPSVNVSVSPHRDPGPAS